MLRLSKVLVVLLSMLFLTIGYADWGDSSSSMGNKTIAQKAAKDRDLSTLVSALKAAGLVDVLQGKGPFTVFAPTNEAFAKLPDGVLQSLLKPENKQKLKNILLYHVITGKVMSKDVQPGDVKAANGDEIKITTDNGTVMLNGNAKVTKVDIKAKNGVIHVIDHVLIPQQ